MLTEIKKVIQPEVQSIKATTQCFQRIYAIKSGICEYLDFMRTIYSNLIEVMRGMLCLEFTWTEKGVRHPGLIFKVL